MINILNINLYKEMKILILILMKKLNKELININILNINLYKEMKYKII